MLAQKVFDLLEAGKIVCVGPETGSFLGKIFGRDPKCICLPRRENICQNKMVGMGKRFGELVEKCFCPGVSMRLEYTPQFVVRIVFGSLQCGGDLRRMVGIIVNDDHAVLCSFIFETAVGPGEREQPFPGRLKRDLEKICRGDRCQRIGNIVSARNG